MTEYLGPVIPIRHFVITVNYSQFTVASTDFIDIEKFLRSQYVRITHDLYKIPVEHHRGLPKIELTQMRNILF